MQEVLCRGTPGPPTTPHKGGYTPNVTDVGMDGGTAISS